MVNTAATFRMPQALSNFHVALADALDELGNAFEPAREFISKLLIGELESCLLGVTAWKHFRGRHVEYPIHTKRNAMLRQV